MSHQLVKYEEKSLAKFGNKVLSALVKQAGMETAAQQALAEAGEAKKVLGFEMLRAVHDMASKDDKLNPYAVSGSQTEVKALNRRILVSMGVLKQEIVDSQIVETWTEPELEAQYVGSTELKEKDQAEYDKRAANWRRLTLALTTACKQTCVLLDNGVEPADLYYNDEGNPVLAKAPKDMQGKDKGEVVLGARKPREGATVSPTLSSLTKLATSGKKASKGQAEEKPGDVVMGMTDESFGSVCNVAIKAINAQEGKFSPGMIKHMKALADVIAKAVK
jgi:hypothetical protein